MSDMWPFQSSDRICGLGGQVTVTPFLNDRLRQVVDKGAYGSGAEPTAGRRSVSTHSSTAYHADVLFLPVAKAARWMADGQAQLEVGPSFSSPVLPTDTVVPAWFFASNSWLGPALDRRGHSGNLSSVSSWWVHSGPAEATTHLTVTFRCGQRQCPNTFIPRSMPSIVIGTMRSRPRISWIIWMDCV